MVSILAWRNQAVKGPREPPTTGRWYFSPTRDGQMSQLLRSREVNPHDALPRPPPYVGRKAMFIKDVFFKELSRARRRSFPCRLSLRPARAFVLTTLLATTALSIPTVSIFFQKYMHLLLGPIFLLLGMFLVGLITVTSGGAMMSEGMQKRVDAMGIWGALLLGILFAVSFCPTSAAWFFGLLALIMGSEAGAITGVLAKVGILLPEASLPGSTVVLPLIYGIGTALPVLMVAFLLAYSAQSVGKTYNILSKVEWWARMITGWIFVLLGIWFSLIYVFKVN